MANKPQTCEHIFYRCARSTGLVDHTQSIQVIGLDTEAYPSGRSFMLSTSLGDTFHMRDFPACMFGRKYRCKKYVAYNLAYDAGAMLQHLPKGKLTELWKCGNTEHSGFRYRVIVDKCLTVTRGKHAITVYDMLNFYETSLLAASTKYLNEDKIDQDPTLFTAKYVRKNWQQIAEYCVQDAVLVQRLAARLIERFEVLGVYPQKLFSTAYVSFQYFRTKCKYVTVQKYWWKHREVLDYALQAYNGGKFEVTCKGIGYFYEYDIVSAYPFEIAKLVDISFARVVHSPVYHKTAIYGFLECNIEIPYTVYSPTVVQHRQLNIFPVGRYSRVITKAEYEYLISQNCDVEIRDAYWLMLDRRTYPYRKEVKRLVKLKQEIKRAGDDLDYHTVKLLLNSLYGKMYQMIDVGGCVATCRLSRRHECYKWKKNWSQKWTASMCWNPIYAAVITANCRIRVSALQQKHCSIVAVHTDSVISTRPLPYPASDKLGALGFETHGDGVILGSGIYQIGDKVRFRGRAAKRDLYSLFDCKGDTATITLARPRTWREVVFHKWDIDRINRFEDVPHELKLHFDRKRIWLDDWKTFSEIPKRNVESCPRVYPELFF